MKIIHKNAYTERSKAGRKPTSNTPKAREAREYKRRQRGDLTPRIIINGVSFIKHAQTGLYVYPGGQLLTEQELRERVS